MKLSYLYSKILEFGIDKDPREDKSKIGAYPDTAVLYGSPEKDIRKVFIGIDIDTAELMLADKIRASKGLDLVFSHHPHGKAYAGMYEVMKLQVDLLINCGLSEKAAKGLMEERMLEVERKISSANHNRAVDAAALLDLPFMCVHTPADNHVWSYLTELFVRNKPYRVSSILEILNGIAEYACANERLAGPKIILGNPNRPCGKILVDMTGGAEGSKEAYDKLYKCGIRTIVSMHLGEEHFKKVKQANLNVVVAGHISSDTLGLNLLLDRIEKIQKLSIISCSGFFRNRRV
ncbi:MAG: NGG1p interacting factor NIF3 [Candidatus Omnitrophota bacterium]